MFDLVNKKITIYDGKRFYTGTINSYEIEQYGILENLRTTLDIINFKVADKVEFDEKTIQKIAKYNNEKLLEKFEREKEDILNTTKYYEKRTEQLREDIENQKKYLSIVSDKIEEETLEGFLRKNFYGTQAFSTRNFAGDPMTTVYDKNGVQVDYCEHYGYIEIFGITEKEFEELQEKGIIE